MDMVTIPKKEYERLKQLERAADIEDQLQESLEDLKAGRIIEYWYKLLFSFYDSLYCNILIFFVWHTNK